MTLKLSIENFNRAKSYLMKRGRDLEQVLFRFHFENGSCQDFLDIISKYQGIDGGFKNMGEGHPDITNAMDTSMAFQYLSEVGATSDHEVIRKGINFIIKSYDHSLTFWHPRHNEISSGWNNNPGAELVGYLYEYRELVPKEFLETVTERAISSIRISKKTYPQYYFLEALCILRLARIDEPYQTEIINRINADIYKIIETEQTKWATTYCAKPLFFAHAPKGVQYINR